MHSSHSRDGKVMGIQLECLKFIGSLFFESVRVTVFPGPRIVPGI